MNEQEQMMQIISAISEKTGETPEKVVAMLQEIMNTEGQEGVKAFIDHILNPDAGMFRKGGKMEAAVNKFQRGGRMSRREFRDTMMSGMGYDKSNFRDAYRNAKIQYGYDRSAAREMMLNSIPKEENKGITYSPTPPVEGHGAPGGQVSANSYVSATSKPSTSEWGASMQPSALDATLRPGSVGSGNIEIKPKISPMPKPHLATPTAESNWDSLSFNEAFRRGRERALSGGQSTFTWRGNEYGTELAKPKPQATTVVDPVPSELKPWERWQNSYSTSQATQTPATGTTVPYMTYARKSGGKINKCQGGRSFGDDGIKRIGVYFDDKTGNREVEDASGRYIRTTFPKDTIWTFNDYGTDRSVYTTPKGRVGYIDDIYGNFDTLSLADIKKVVDAVEARMKNFTKDERRNYIINRYGDEMLMPENKSSKDKKK